MLSISDMLVTFFEVTVIENFGQKGSLRFHCQGDVPVKPAYGMQSESLQESVNVAFHSVKDKVWHSVTQKKIASPGAILGRNGEDFGCFMQPHLN